MDTRLPIYDTPGFSRDSPLALAIEPVFSEPVYHLLSRASRMADTKPQFR